MGDCEVTVVTNESMGEDDPLLARLLAAATAGAPPAGPASKRKPTRIVLDPDEHPVGKGTLCAQARGSNFHAATPVAANDEQRRLAARGESRTEPFGVDSGRLQGAAKRRILEVFKRAATQPRGRGRAWLGHSRRGRCGTLPGFRARQTVPKTPERRRGDFLHGLLGRAHDLEHDHAVTGHATRRVRAGERAEILRVPEIADGGRPGGNAELAPLNGDRCAG
jgi:hypothetical protein